MNLHNVRKELADTLRGSGLTQYEFATKHGLSYSWVNKFLNEAASNPRNNSLEALQAAIAKEQRTTARAVS
jgi:transcriptional regulator with XRE-family HTH domain